MFGPPTLAVTAGAGLQLHVATYYRWHPTIYKGLMFYHRSYSVILLLLSLVLCRVHS